MKRRRGYILLTTLLLLALAATAMVGVSQRSLKLALEAARAEEDLQRRWGVLTSQSALLPMAGNILAKAEQAEKRSLPSTALSLRLGRQEFTLVIFDEQAKFNVNVFYQKKQGVETERAVRQLLPMRASGEAVRLDPLPKRIDPKTNQSEDAFVSFGQLFAPGTSAATLLGDESHTGWTRELTLWSDGRLNFRRASPEVVMLVCTPVLNGAQVQELLALRDQPRPLPLAQILAKIQLSRSQRAQAEALLSEGSTCYSLWMVVQNPRRRWYHLAVAPAGPEATPVYFEW